MGSVTCQQFFTSFRYARHPNRLPDSRRGFARQADRERRAVFRGRGHVDSPAVRLGDFAGDVQAHADAAGAVALRVFGAGAADERVEDFRQFARRNGIAAVVNVDEDVRRFATERKRDREIRRAVLDGVAHQVGDGLADAVGIPQAVQVAVGAKLNVAVGVGGAELFNQFTARPARSNGAGLTGMPAPSRVRV